MEKTKLHKEQMIAGGLLKFESVSNLDIAVLIFDFFHKYPDYEVNNDELASIRDYVEINDGVISLKSGLNLESILGNELTLRERLEQIAGDCINNYCQNLDIEEFILRKIDHRSGVIEDRKNNLFCKIQQEKLKKLEEKGYVITIWQREAIYDDYREIKLSIFGKLKLFKIDSAKEISRFTEMLKSMRYDTNLLDDFLLKQDLDMPVWSVLDLEKLAEFCSFYDRAISEEGVSSIDFARLQSDEKTILKEQGRQFMRGMLGVWSNNCIHICHPNHLFAGTKLLTKDVRELVNVNWDDIDIEKMLDKKDYKTFVSDDWSRAFRYVHKRLGHQIMNEIKNGNEDGAVSYLAVVEEYADEYGKHYLVRGIIRGDSEGYSVAFNPEYQKTIPCSIWEKALRMGDNETPAAYLAKRPK